MRIPNFFFLLLSPPSEVVADVSSFKEDVRSLVGHKYRSFHSIAHLTLFQYFDFHNESKLYKYEEQVSNFPQFEIKLRDFSAFEKNGTIYLNIEYGGNVCSLAETLGYSIKPHITIARGLTPRDFDLVWSHFKEMSYNYLFTCSSVTVLKRLKGRWAPHMDLHLHK
jgi:2'-5' RNA ligase